MKIGLIVNPQAGKKNIKRFLPQIEKTVSSKGQLTTFVTHKRKDCFDLAYQLSNENYSIIIGCGGDGTINEIINGIFYSNNLPLLGLIPQGTSNVYAITFQIPTNPIEASKIILKNNIKKVDVGVVENSEEKKRYFLSMIGVGFDAWVTYLVPYWLRTLIGGVNAHIVTGIVEFLFHRSFIFEIEFNNQKYRASQVIVSNSPFYGGNTHLAPEAKVDDSLLDICMLKRDKPKDIISFAINIKRKKYASLQNIISSKSQYIKIKGNKIIPFQTDGEADIWSNKIEIRILPKKLSIITP